MFSVLRSITQCTEYYAMKEKKKKLRVRTCQVRSTDVGMAHMYSVPAYHMHATNRDASSPGKTCGCVCVLPYGGQSTIDSKPARSVPRTQQQPRACVFGKITCAHEGNQAGHTPDDLVLHPMQEKKKRRRKNRRAPTKREGG